MNLDMADAMARVVGEARKFVAQFDQEDRTLAMRPLIDALVLLDETTDRIRNDLRSSYGDIIVHRHEPCERCGSSFCRH
jgi:hypothetical protein